MPVLDPSYLINQDGSSRLPTPLRKSLRLGEALKLKSLWIKDETANLTRTFKDRDALVTLSRFHEINISEFTMASTGNTAAAFVNIIGRTRIPFKAHVFLPKAAIIDFALGDEGRADIRLVDGDYTSAIEAAKEFSKASGIPSEGGFSNPCRAEAAKTIAYEIAESNLKPDWYVQGVTSGAGVYGFHKGYRELIRFGISEAVPRLLCVQPDGCAPMVKAFKSGRERLARQDVPTSPQTFVTTLSCTNPAFSYPYVREAVLDSKGNFEEVSDRETARAFMLLLKLEGKLVDPAAAVALAGITKALETGTIGSDETIVLSLSGGIRGNVLS